MTFRARGLYASSSKEPSRFRWGPWMVLGGVLVVILVVLTAVSVLGNVVSHQSERADSYGVASELRLSNDTGGRIQVSSAEGEQIVVERTLRGGPLSEPRESVEESGDRLDIETRCSGPLFFSRCSVEYAIRVPEGVFLTLETVSGDVQVQDLNGNLAVTTTSGSIEVFDHEGEVRAETTSGDMELSEVTGSITAQSTSGSIDASGEGELLEVSTTSGDIVAAGFRAQQVRTESVSGDLEFGGGFTSLETSTTSGDVEIRTDTVFDLMSVETISGDVEAWVPEGVYAIDGESTSGGRDFNVDTSPDADSRIEVDTTSGSVRVG